MLSLPVRNLHDETAGFSLERSEVVGAERRRWSEHELGVSESSKEVVSGERRRPLARLPSATSGSSASLSFLFPFKKANLCGDSCNC